MAPKVRLDELNANTLDASGEHISAKTARDQARRIADEAKEALPGGLPEDSPYRKMTQDQCLAEAARVDMRFGPLMAEDELRLVLEVLRQKMAKGDVKPPAPQPQTPMQPAPPPRKIRGLRPSASHTWVVGPRPENAPAVAVGNGQMSKLKAGTRIELRHYTRDVLQGMVDQGIKLIPIEETEAEED